MNTDQCDSGDANASKEVPSVTSGGWFSRIFSRGTANDHDARDNDETDGDENIAELAKNTGADKELPFHPQA